MFSKGEGKRGSMSDRFERFESLSEDRRRAIMDAASEVFGDEDYARASTADIARRAGVSKSQLFFYFKNNAIYISMCSQRSRGALLMRWSMIAGTRLTTSSRLCVTP